jgi:CelD/BcsL family acetyltransferase involved in cellulose biosynthesis
MNMATRHVTEDLSVALLRDINDVEGLRSEWDALHSQDPLSGVFLSWHWMMEAFRGNSGRYVVLVARSKQQMGQVVGILPLKSRVHWSRSQKALQTQYHAGGRLIWSEYTGFLCNPAFETQVLDRFARTFSELPWVSLSMRYVDQEERIELFRAAFPKETFEAKFKAYRINKGETNNLVSPQVDLPETFEAYLAEKLSTKFRKQFRRFERIHLLTGDLHFTVADEETFGSHIKILLDFWMLKWAPVKGLSTAKKAAANYRRTLQAGLNTGTLFLPVLWKGDQPLGALGHILDPDLRKVHFIVVGRDTDTRAGYIGQFLHLGSIEWAIAHGYRLYDFCHGDEPYKFSYGAENADLKYLSIKRKDLESGEVLDPYCARDALIRIKRFLESDQTDAALQACNQLIDSQAFPQ